MGAKDHCRVIHCTIDRIKARNPAKRLSFSFSKKAKCRIPRRWLKNDPRPSVLRMKILVFLRLLPTPPPPPSYSSIPAVHLITTVYTTVVRTRECVRVREAGAVTAALLIRLFCRQDVSLVSCACEGECVAVLRPLISDQLPYILL